MNSKKIAFGSVATAILFGSLALPALASTPPSGVDSAPNSCWDHGSFQYFENGQNGGQGLFGTGSFIDGGTLSQDAVADPGMGAETGPANSAPCQ